MAKGNADNLKGGKNKSLNSLIVLLVCLLVLSAGLLISVDPYSKSNSHYYRMLLAGWSIILLIAYIYRCNKLAGGPILSFSKMPVLFSTDWFLLFVLCGSCIAGIFNYYQFDKTYFTKLKDNNDTAYYYLNSKYFKELDYFNLYKAVLIADEESSQRLTHVSVFRDLDTYGVYLRSSLNEDVKNSVKRKFEPERWEQFKHDVSYLVVNNRPEIWDYFFIDHGYNPPPTWTVVGGFFSGITPVENAKIITMLDFVLVFIMFIVIARVFSVDVMFFCMLFFLCTFSGRWPVLGESLLRFDWLVALVLSVCMLKKERFMFAGALLAYSAVNRVFPAIFFFPYLVYMAHGIYVNRKIEDKHWRFIQGAAVTAVFFVVVGLALYGVGAFKTSAKNLVLHQNSSFSSHRVGLADALVYRGELTRPELERNGGVDGKQNQINAMKPGLYVLALLLMVLITIWGWKKQKPPHELIYLALLPLFCLTTPQINYFNMRQLLMLYHMSDPLKKRNIIGLCLLFFIELITQYTMVQGHQRYAVTSVTSIGLTIYFVVMVSVMLMDLMADSERFAAVKRICNLGVRTAGASAIALGGIYAMTVMLYWNYGKAKVKEFEEASISRVPIETRQQAESLKASIVQYERLQHVKQSGDRWNSPRSAIIKKGSSILIAWNDAVSHADKINISFDNNDRYRLDYIKDDKSVAAHTIVKPKDGVRSGLQQLVIDVPSNAVEQGYDKVKIQPSGGDGYYSIGHFVLMSETKPNE